MKSSNSFGDDFEPRTLKAWAPADFSKRAEATRLTSAEQMLAILGPLPESEQAGRKAAEEIRLIRAGEASQIHTHLWDPGEVSPQSNLPQKSGRSAEASIFPGFTVRHTENQSERRLEAFPKNRPVFDDKKVEELIAEARSRSEKIIQQAQYSAGEVIKQSKVESQQALEEGFRKGQKEGFEKGHTAGYAEARAEAASAIQAAHTMISELAAWRDEMVAQSEESVVGMIRQIARLMFGEGIQMDKNTLQRYLNEVMETTRSLGDLNIFLNPDDYNQLDSAWAEYHTQIRGSRVRTIGSSGILPGGCYVKGQMGTVDARVETKLEAVIESLKADPEPEDSE